MSKTAIKVENLGKMYRLGEVGTGTIGQDLNRWWARMRGKEDPYAKIGETNDRTTKGNSNFVWSLKDIDFEVQQGEAVGIIGRNGAGKSTLLKILSKVTAPTTGRIKINGRIASLLEVGTGFHPDLTGRENIFLNGAILGMTKAEIRSKFDEIVDFAGIERYIDTPVKRYSSGMYVRLAFAVAAHLEPEILIIDEVLAVGDLEFQKKCLGKMNDVSQKDGRTILFVSHNITAIQNLCNKCILLKQGKIIAEGTTNKVLDNYVNTIRENLEYAPEINLENFTFERSGNNKAYFTRIELIDRYSNSKAVFKLFEDFKIRLTIFAKQDIEDCIIGIGVVNNKEEFVFATNHYDTLNDTPLKKGINIFECTISPNFLASGDYFLNLAISLKDFTTTIDYLPKVSIIKIEEVLNDEHQHLNSFLDPRPGVIKPLLNWIKI